MIPMEDLIEEFWETVIDCLPELETDTNKVLIIGELREKLYAIDEDLQLEIKPCQISMVRYKLPAAYKPYIDKMILLRFNLEITVSGNLAKFPLVEQVWQMHKQYEIPDNWTVVKFYSESPANPEDNIFIQFDKTMISVGSVKYVLTKLKDLVSTSDSIKTQDPIAKNIEIYHDIASVRSISTVNLDNLYDLIIILEDAFADTLQTQDQIYQLRNSVMLWLESQIGEYHSAINIARLTIIPEKGFIQLSPYQDPKNGCYLISELQEMTAHLDRCCLCELPSINTTVTKPAYNPEYPYINGFHCEYCLRVLKNFRPLWLKLRNHFGPE